MEVCACGCMVTMTIPLTTIMYNGVGVNLEISVVDLSTGEVGPAETVRAELGWTVGELKQNIEKVSGKTCCHTSLASLVLAQARNYM